MQGRKKSAGIAQQVEHFTRNEGVASSNLVSSFLNHIPRGYGFINNYGLEMNHGSVVGWKIHKSNR